MPIRIIVLVLILSIYGGCSPPGGVFHKVEKGQTLYRISRVYHVDEAELAALNGIEDPTRIPVGTRLFIPDAERTRRVPATAVAHGKRTDGRAEVQGRAGGRTTPGTGSPRSRKAKKNPPPEPPRTASQKADPPDRATKISFAWPLRGDLLKSFGNDNASSGKGVEIAAAPRTPVHSAAPGKVIYSGDGIRGYGNLVILRHQDSFFSVYGYNRRNLVEAGAFVGRGDKIALSGAPPGGGKPRLYFEIRRGKQAVDPIFYLP